MNINLIYQNNSFKFDLKKDVSIQYLENLASKLINKDKTFFDLSYNDNIITGHPNKPLKDIINSETNICITISPKKNKSVTKIQKVLPQLKKSNYSMNNTESNETKNNIITNDIEISQSQSFSDNSIKALQHLSKQVFLKKNKTKKSYITKNLVFEEVYNAKDNELFRLLNDLSQKIKEYDDVLFKNCKKSFNKNNSELLLYEKHILNFKDKQIKFIQRLISYFENQVNNFLKELYKEINNYDKKELFLGNNNNRNKIYNLDNEILSPNIQTEEKISSNHKGLPLLLNNNNLNKAGNKINKLYLSQNSTINDTKMDRLLFDKKNKIQLISNANKNHQIQSNKSNNKMTILKKPTIENTTKANTVSNTNQSDNSIVSKTQEKTIDFSNKYLPKKTKRFNDAINENNIKKTIINSIDDDIQNEIQNNEQNNKQTNIQHYFQNNLRKDSYKNKNRNNLKEYMEKSEKHRRVSTVENINYNKNKVCSLFEISESYLNENKNSSSSSLNNSSRNSSEDSEEISRKKKESIKLNHNFNGFNEVKNFKKSYREKSKKNVNYCHIKNSNYGCLLKAKSRKIKQRIKRLGNNVNDFLI